MVKVCLCVVIVKICCFDNWFYLTCVRKCLNTLDFTIITFWYVQSGAYLITGTCRLDYLQTLIFAFISPVLSSISYSTTQLKTRTSFIFISFYYSIFFTLSIGFKYECLIKPTVSFLFFQGRLQFDCSQAAESALANDLLN